MRELTRIKRCRERRGLRARKKVFGAADKPRLVVLRSGRHIYCQLVDDAAGRTVAAASTASPELREGVKACSWNKKGAEKVGELIAVKARAGGITRVCFDRNGYKFHGRVKALADSARKHGLVF